MLPMDVVVCTRLFPQNLRCAWLDKHERGLKWLRQLIVCAYTFFERSFLSSNLVKELIEGKLNC